MTSAAAPLMVSTCSLLFLWGRTTLDHRAALRCAVQEKPSASTYEALTFISRWLLENNPNKPRILTQDDFAREEEEDDEAEFAEVSGAESPLPPSVPPTLL